MQETRVQFMGGEDPLEKEMATHSSILAWRIPWKEEPGSLLSMGSEESDMTEQLTCSFSLFVFLFYLQRHDSCLQEADGRFEVKIMFLSK